MAMTEGKGERTDAGQLDICVATTPAVDLSGQ